MSPAGVLRRAAQRDIDAVIALWTRLTEYHASFEPLFALRTDSDAAIRSLLTAQLRDPNGAVFVYEQGQRVGGFCSVRIDRAPPIHEEVERAEITDILVSQEVRRGGVGRGLVELALAWVRERGVGRVEVRVAVRNGIGQAFWRDLGFGDLMDVLELRL